MRQMIFVGPITVSGLLTLGQAWTSQISVLGAPSAALAGEASLAALLAKPDPAKSSFDFVSRMIHGT